MQAVSFLFYRKTGYVLSFTVRVTWPVLGSGIGVCDLLFAIHIHRTLHLFQFVCFWFRFIPAYFLLSV